MHREASGSYDYVRCIEDGGQITLALTTRGSSRILVLGPIRKFDSKPDETLSAKDSLNEASFHLYLAGLNIRHCLFSPMVKILASHISQQAAFEFSNLSLAYSIH